VKKTEVSLSPHYPSSRLAKRYIILRGREFRRAHHLSDLAAMPAEVKTQKIDPLNSIQRSRDEMRKYDRFKIRAIQDGLQPIQYKLGNAKLLYPEEHRPANTRGGAGWRSLAWLPGPSNDFIDGQAPVRMFPHPDRLPDSYPVCGRPNPTDPVDFRKRQVLQILANGPNVWRWFIASLNLR